MTVEEALVALLAAAAGIFLFLGLAQGLDSPPSPALRRARMTRRGPRTATGEAVAGVGPLPGVGESGLPAIAGAENGPALVSVGVPADPAQLTEQPGEPTEDEGHRLDRRLEPATEDLLEIELGAVTAPALLEPSAELLKGPLAALLERAASLYAVDRHAELLAAVEAELAEGDVPDAEHPAHGMAALWSLAGLSHHALGDEAAARKDVAIAARLAPQPVWQGCPPLLASLAVHVAQRLLERVERAPEGHDERIAGARLAAFWLRWRLVAAPGDGSTLALLDDAREALSAGYWDVVADLIGRGEFAGARAVIQDGIEADELPAARGEALLELLWTQLTKEIERLTGPAIRPSGADSAAVRGLEGAEALLGSMRDRAIPAEHRTPMTRRLWRGYMRFGTRQLRAGKLDAAFETLMRALSMKDIDRARQRQVRDGLIQILQRLGEQKREAVARLLAEGNRAGAEDEVEELTRRIERARAGGIAQEHLAPALGRARELATEVEARDEDVRA